MFNFMQLGTNVKVFKQFYMEFPHASEQAANRYVDIVQAGEAIQSHHSFRESGHIPWSSFSNTEERIYKAYVARLDSSNPPNLKSWIEKLEYDYGEKILRGW